MAFYSLCGRFLAMHKHLGQYYLCGLWIMICLLHLLSHSFPLPWSASSPRVSVHIRSFRRSQRPLVSARCQSCQSGRPRRSFIGSRPYSLGCSMPSPAFSSGSSSLRWILSGVLSPEGGGSITL
ncbi:hypothetical protein BXZ70DRAFT_225776 [Cristinia sonorae]|uniref:Uncharacterized protein n=1 Tax=Cristinia sonorae TaxID=1940300 RepID=A0A8K0UMD2_9AGAR|nr:hypothetical protein BXZ70DRAFT_225776 [Cristinia sonorae]